MAAAQLKVRFREDFEDEAARPGGDGDGDPRLAWQLPDFFWEWMVPGLLKGRGTRAGTIDLYADSLRYWQAITGGPTLGELSLKAADAIGINFTEQLGEWGYSRRGMRRGERQRIGRIDDHPSYWPLKSTTAAAHASRIATVLRRAGPRYDPREATAEIITRCPLIPEVRAMFETKPPFDLGRARAIYAATQAMTRPGLPAGWPLALWWRTRVGLFYFTGLRAGTIVELRRRHVRTGGGEAWLDVPAELVHKTGKAVQMPLHAQLAELVAQLPPGQPEDLLLPEACCYRHFLTLHDELLGLAGVPQDERQSPHAWRRTNLTELGYLGLSQAREVSRIAADHSDGRTTESHYVGQAFVNMLRLRLPRLDAA